jgi:hypothetical protein
LYLRVAFGPHDRHKSNDPKEPPVTVSSIPAEQVHDESNVDPTIGRRTATDRRQHVRMTNDFFTTAGKLESVADPVERMAAKGLLGASIGMCDELGTDGHIQVEAVLEATGLPPQYAKVLMTCDAWHQADHGCRRCPQPRQGHVYVHDFLLHNRTAEQKQRTSERRRQAGQTGLDTRWDGHQKALPTGRPPGRPRKQPALSAAPVVVQQPGVALVPFVQEGEVVLEHPAEIRAREAGRRGRPRRTEPKVFAPIVDELCKLLADEIASNDPNGLRPNVTDTWRNQCRLMIEKDGREPDKIRKAILWCQRDSFWHSNIKSMPTLREKYATLSARAHEEKLRKLGRSPGRRTTEPAAVAVPGMNELYDDDNVPGGRP